MVRRKGPDEVFCRSCGEPIKRAAERCPNCGVPNEAATSAAASGSAPETAPLDLSGAETADSDHWYLAVVAGIGLSVLGIVALSGDPTGLTEDVGGYAFLGGWFLLPLGIYYDTRFVSAHSRWKPSPGIWVLLALLWFVNVVVGAVYLYRRHQVLGVP